MKVLVATGRTQGARGNDYHHGVEGELVRIDPPCRKDRDDPDGGCGCGRGFAGMSSRRGTTTACVVELPLTREEYAEALRSSLERDGFDQCSSRALDEADGLAELAAYWPVGVGDLNRLYRSWIRPRAGRLDAMTLSRLDNVLRAVLDL